MNTTISKNITKNNLKTQIKLLHKERNILKIKEKNLQIKQALLEIKLMMEEKKW